MLQPQVRRCLALSDTTMIKWVSTNIYQRLYGEIDQYNSLFAATVSGTGQSVLAPTI